MPVATAAALPNKRVDPGHLPGGFRVRRGKHLQTARRIGGDELAVGGAHRRIDGIAGAQRLAAALAGAVARVERIGASMSAWTAALLRGKQAVADRERAGLVELDVLVMLRSLLSRSSGDRPISRRMFSAIGPLRRSLAFALEWRDSRSRCRGRGKCTGSDRSCDGLAEYAVQAGLGDRASAESGDDGGNLDAGCPYRAMRTFVATMPPMPTARAFLQHHNALGVLQRASRTAASGNGRNEVIAKHADLQPVVTHLVHRVLDGAEHGTERDHDGFGAVHAIRAHQAAGIAAKDLPGTRLRCEGSAPAPAICLAWAR